MCFHMNQKAHLADRLTVFIRHKNQQYTWLVISAVLLKLKDFWRSQAVTHTVHMSETVQDTDFVTTDH